MKNNLIMGSLLFLLSGFMLPIYASQVPDAQMQKVLDTFSALGAKPVQTLTPSEARAQPTIADAVNAILKQQGHSTDPKTLFPDITSADVMVDGAVGKIPARVFTPNGHGPFPVIVYFHGGGWVYADRMVYDASARGLAHEAKAVVLSVDYRRAPEDKFPAAHEDALAAYKWVIGNIKQLNGNPDKLALAGESAGGGLAVATALAVRDAGLTAPKHILAIYPVAQTDTHTASYNTYSNATPLSRPAMLWFISHVFKSKEDLNDNRINLVKAPLINLPRTTIINAEIDPLRDDGLQLKAALKKAGISVERRLYPGVTHEFFGTAAVVSKAKEAQKYAGSRLKETFATRD